MKRLIALLTVLCSSMVLGWPAAMCAEAGGEAKPASTLTLKLSHGPSLVDCAPVTQSPCMSATLTPVDASGQPAPLSLPPAEELAHAISLHGNDGDVQPFFATAGAGPDAAQHGNAVLLLLDISGSMNQPAPGSDSRIAALKQAVGEFISGMHEGSDRIAIVPFESHNVVPTIRSAVYVSSKSDAMAQLNAMPQPSSHNNTALYQAVFSGVESLRSEVSTLQRDSRASAEVQPHLVVMTDGKNEVMAGDDAQLLNGPLGLQQAAAQVQSSHIDVLGIGFGDRASIDADAMRRLSTRFVYATDAGEVLAALHTSRSETSHQIQMMWLVPAGNRLALMGRDFVYAPVLHLPSGTALSGESIRWMAPATNAPGFVRHAMEPELQALIAVHPSADSGWTSVLTYALLFVAASVFALALWFWVPRLVWGDRHMAAAAAARWSSERGSMTSAAGVQVRSGALPAGFDAAVDRQMPVQRSASQITQVPVRGEFSRTRLTFEEN